MEKETSYRSLEEIRTKKEDILAKIRLDNKETSILWKSLFKKDEQQKKGLTLASVLNTGMGLADGFILAWKLYRKFKK